MAKRFPNSYDDKVKRFTDKKFLLGIFEDAAGTFLSAFQTSHVATRKLNKNTSSCSHIQVYLNERNLVDIQTLINCLDEVVIGKCEGKVFLGRLITGAMKLSAIHFVVEDPAGERAIRVSVYNWPFSMSVFSKGTVVAMVHPYLKSCLDGGLTLRCDEPGDVVVLSEDQVKTKFPNAKWLGSVKKKRPEKSTGSEPDQVPQPLDLEDPVARLGSEGNQYFAERKYEMAIEKYTEGLVKAPDKEKFLSNRAICHLKLENYQLALDDALRCLEFNYLHVKAVYRAAKAYIGLKEYGKAKDFLEMKLISHSTNVDIKALLARTKELITQKNTGLYNMAKLYKSMGKSTLHEIADYTGPLEIYDTGSKGRGLRLTENVNPGQLLLCSQAFAVVYSSKSYSRVMEDILALEPYRRELVTTIARKIKNQPEAKRELYELFAGNKRGRLNASQAKSAEIDLTRIRKILDINGLEIPWHQSFCLGLWILPSYINNDCINPNASLTVFGNVCQIRCFKPIKAGEEVLIAYHYHACSLWLRSLMFKMKDFECQCAICLYERGEPEEKRFNREKLLQKFQNGGFRHPQKLRQVITKVKAISAGSPFVDYYVALILIRLGDRHFEKGEYKMALEVYSEFVVDWQRFGGDITALLPKASQNALTSTITSTNIIRVANNGMKWMHLFLENVRLVFGCSDYELLQEMNLEFISIFS